MDPVYANHGEDVYSPEMMTPPPENTSPSLECHPKKQINTFRKPPTPESLPRTTVDTQVNRQSSTVSNHRRRRSTATSDSIFSPRDPQDLARERAYIGQELEKQSGCKTELIRRYAVAESDFNAAHAADAKQRRRLKKQVSKARALLNEAGNNERALAIRWSELCIEMNNRETWAQAQWERRMSLAVEYFTLSPLSITQDPPWRSESLVSTPLKATSPDFVPWGLPIGSIVAGGPQGSLEPVEEDGEECSDDHNQRFEYEGHEEEESKSEVSSQRRLSFDIEMPSPREKRLSLPNLQSLWP